MRWFSFHYDIRFIGKGDSVGYGRTFVAGRDSRIAVIPVGYGDLFSLAFFDKYVIIYKMHGDIAQLGERYVRNV